MASGRVGGTKSKVRGVVGDDVYQVRREADGSYAQIVRQKSNRVYTSNSYKQAAHRMGTAIVEAFMRDVRPVANISMQSAANKSKSLNAVSSWNLLRVYQDIKDNWESFGDFQYNLKHLDARCGGKFLVSSGTLMFNSFSGKIYGDYYRHGILFEGSALPSGVDMYSGIFWQLDDDVNTIEQLMKQFNIDLRSKICYVDFSSDPNIVDDSNPDDIQVSENYAYHYAILSVDEYAIMNSVGSLAISPVNLSKLFLVESSFSGRFYYNASKRVLGFIHGMPISPFGNAIYQSAAFTIAYPRARKQVSSSELLPTHPSFVLPMTEHRPCDVFFSYVDLPVGSKPSSPLI